MTTSLSEFKQAAIVNTLRSCRLFLGLSPEDLNAIADITMVKSLDKGDYLFREGDLSHGFYLVQRGAINVHRNDTHLLGNLIVDGTTVLTGDVLVVGDEHIQGNLLVDGDLQIDDLVVDPIQANTLTRRL